MSRFGWAYVSDVITGSGGSTTPGGSDKAIQFASGSTFSGSTNFTFDYNTNTVRLTGTLYADNLIVSSSQILKSGSTIFGDDLLDTHQFTGSVYVTGVVSSSTGIQSAGAITSQGIISSSLGFQTNTTVEAAGNITSQAIISSSNGFQTNSTIDAVGNIRTTNGDLSSSIGIQTGGFLTVAGATNLKSGLTVTGSSFVQALSSSGQIQATSFAGNGLNIIGVQATNVDGAGDDWAVQFKSGDTGTLTGSSNLLFSGSTLTLTGSLLMSGTSYISEVDYIDFDVAASTPSHKNGRVFWNNTDGCLNVYNAEADVTLQVGQENWTRIRNNTGTTVTNGTIVRIIGAQGDAPIIERAQSILKSGSINVDTQILGVATHDIEDSSFGYVTTQGLVRGLNTNAFADGETLFVGTGSAGVLQNTAPVAPYEIIPVGVCVKAGPGTSGIIYVAVQQPLDFPDLSTVFVSGTYDYGDIWTYVSSSNTGYWIHTKTLSGSYTITGSLTLTGTLSGTTAQFTTITGSTVTGSTALFTTITASVVSASSYVGPIPKHAIFAASGVSTGSNYEVITINGNKYLQLQKRRTFPIARSIGAADLENGWIWFNRISISGSSTENTTVVSGANFVHAQSANTTWTAASQTAPVRYKTYTLLAGQTMQVVSKIAATASLNFEQVQLLVWASGSNTNYVRVGVGYDTGTKIVTQYTSNQNVNTTISASQMLDGVWFAVNIAEDNFSSYYNFSTSSTPPASGWLYNTGGPFILATNHGRPLNVGQMIMNGHANPQTVTGSFSYFDVGITRNELTNFVNPNPYVSWPATQFDTSGTEQLIGEYDLGSSATVNETALRQLLSDLENNQYLENATITWSAVQSSSSGAASGTFYSSNAVVISGSGRYFRLWVKITSNGNQAGSIGPFPIVIPIS